MLPNACNTSLRLLNIVGSTDSLGNKELVIKSSKEVVGITKSITSSEFQTAVMMNIKYELKISIVSFLYDGSKYAKIKNSIYKIERTYLNGQFIELYLTLSDLKESDFDESNIG